MLAELCLWRVHLEPLQQWVYAPRPAHLIADGMKMWITLPGPDRLGYVLPSREEMTLACPTGEERRLVSSSEQGKKLTWDGRCVADPCP